MNFRLVFKPIDSLSNCTDLVRVMVYIFLMHKRRILHFHCLVVALRSFFRIDWRRLLKRCLQPSLLVGAEPKLGTHRYLRWIELLRTGHEWLRGWCAWWPLFTYLWSTRRQTPRTYQLHALYTIEGGRWSNLKTIVHFIFELLMRDDALETLLCSSSKHRKMQGFIRLIILHTAWRAHYLFNSAAMHMVVFRRGNILDYILLLVE